MKNLFIFILIGLTFSCQPSDNTDNYTFSAEDSELLPIVYSESNRKFTFKNELNELVEISATYYNRQISYEGSGFGNASSHPGNYEALKINLEVISEQNEKCINKNISIYKNFDQSISVFLENTSIPYPCSGSYIIESVKSPFEYSTMDINGILYNKVIVFDYPNASESPFFHKDYIIDKVYYDLKNGFIGFNDTSKDVHFRLIQ